MFDGAARFVEEEDSDMETDLPEHVRKNRAAWDVMAKDYVETGEHAWAETEPSWGVFSIPESEVGMLPADV